MQRAKWVGTFIYISHTYCIKQKKRYIKQFNFSYFRLRINLYILILYPYIFLAYWSQQETENTPPPPKKKANKQTKNRDNVIYFFSNIDKPLFYDNFKCFMRIRCTQKEDNRFHYHNSILLLYYKDNSTKIYTVFF